MAKNNPSDSGRLALIQQQLAELKSMTLENRHILVGRDGNPGLVGNVALLRDRICLLEGSIKNDLAHAQAKYDLMLESRDRLRLQKDEQQKENTLTKGEIFSRWLMPIILQIITAILVYFIVTSGLAQ